MIAGPLVMRDFLSPELSVLQREVDSSPPVALKDRPDGWQLLAGAAVITCTDAACRQR